MEASDARSPSRHVVESRLEHALIKGGATNRYSDARHAATSNKGLASVIPRLFPLKLENKKEQFNSQTRNMFIGKKDNIYILPVTQSNNSHFFPCNT